MGTWYLELSQRAGAVAAPLLLLPLIQVAAAQGFKFQPLPGADRPASAAVAPVAAADRLSASCRKTISGKKTVVIIGEHQSDGQVAAQQQNYGPHFQGINARLQALGVRTFTPEEVRKQIAQAEIDAYFKNDPDKALSASSRLGASFVLRGLITSQSTLNPVLKVNQVSVGMGFTLAAANGLSLADANAAASSYAGPDVRAMALTLLDEHADEVLSTLYSTFCRNHIDSPPANAKVKR